MLNTVRSNTQLSRTLAWCHLEYNSTVYSTRVGCFNKRIKHLFSNMYIYKVKACKFMTSVHSVLPLTGWNWGISSRLIGSDRADRRCLSMIYQTLFVDCLKYNNNKSLQLSIMDWTWNVKALDSFQECEPNQPCWHLEGEWRRWESTDTKPAVCQREPCAAASWSLHSDARGTEPGKRPQQSLFPALPRS